MTWKEFSICMVRSNPNFNGSRTTTPSTQQQDTGSGNSGDAGRIYGSGSDSRDVEPIVSYYSFQTDNS
ncbi:hypothetical protein YC2023_109794 [Brassica napus]